VTQALRAHVLFKRDVDYVVKEGEVIIVDEFTGRQMPGRRWSDGLHQAVEAKEGVRIESENVTLATITIQNYFRMYAKLAGMTGTADTEAVEFQKTYKLDVAVIPPNKPTARTDNADVVYLSEREKFDAVVQEIGDCHERGQPVLVGTTSVEKSERVSKLLKKAGVRHNVLNAINHEAEANIIAQAGRHAQVTIATNMAGRGTDILLGGNPEYLARADMENDWIRQARKAGGGGETRTDERFEDTLRALHERYDEEKQGLRERFEAELARLEGARAEALKALSDAEEKLRKASPLRAIFERYERVKEVEFDPSVRHGDTVPDRYRQMQAEIDAALDERAAVVAAPARTRLARLREQFVALQHVWDEVRTQERRPTRATAAPGPMSFRAALAEVLLSGMDRAEAVAAVNEALSARGTLAEDEAPWLARFEAGQIGIVGAQPPVVEAVSERLTGELGGEAFAAAALTACRGERETAAEGLDAWRFEYEKAAREVELLILLGSEDDAERVAWAGDYRAAEQRHATAEHEYEACRQPYDEGMRAAERRYDEQRAVYTRQVAEIREELQKAPQAYEARFRESLERYQALCRDERDRVVAAGGLHIIGTERHEARRIDNQLRGRAGRQGDPGSSRFYLSLEDDLLRIFGADRMQKLMERLGMKEGEPIEHRMLTRAVRNAQEKVEAHNFDVRKHLLEYDDVLNRQREVIYARRRELLASADLKSDVVEMAERLAGSVAATYADAETASEEWDWKTFDDAVFAQFNFHLQVPEAEHAGMRPEALEERLAERVREVYEQREQSFGASVLRYLERFFWLQTMDTLWREHLVAMEHLKEGIGLRGYGQKNPLQEYQKEGYELFEELVGRMEVDVIEKLMSVQVQAGAVPAAVRPRVAAAGGGESRPVDPPAPAVPDAVADIERRQQQQRARMQVRLSHGEQGAQAQRPETVRRDAEKVGRNDPCPCGSGKKYKKCHGAG
jgi:preprotein translocase subunit SecA